METGLFHYDSSRILPIKYFLGRDLDSHEHRDIQVVHAEALDI